jgi:acyl carrier protein
MTNGHLQNQVLEDLSRLLSNFQGRAYCGPMDAGTRFFGDLGLASIDAVVLGEELQSHYGRALSFGELMADLGVREDRDVTLGELAEYVARRLRQAEEPHHAAH